MLFARPKKAIGLDIGTHSVKAVQMSRSGGRLYVEAAGYAVLDRNQMNIDPVATMASAVRESLRFFNMPQSIIVGALPGPSVVIRYPRFPQMSEDQLDQAIEKEAGQHIPYDLAEVFLDWTLLDTITQGNDKLLKILLVAVKHEAIDTRVQIADAAELQYSILGVDSLSLADAAEGCDFLRVGETVALVDIGLTSVSIHFVKDGISNFIRDINWGAKELIQALVRARRLDFEQAEKLLREAGTKKEVAAPPPFVEQPSALEEPAPSPPSAASLLEPFEDELEAVSPRTSAVKAVSEGEKNVDEILTTPLNRLVSEIRRSFDYYEHELYESPVDRMILSGGVAHIPVLRQTLSDELGIKTVEVADPSMSALVFSDERAAAPLMQQPAQFMVAVGLAARGMVEL